MPLSLYDAAAQAFEDLPLGGEIPAADFRVERVGASPLSLAGQTLVPTMQKSAPFAPGSEEFNAYARRLRGFLTYKTKRPYYVNVEAQGDGARIAISFLDRRDVPRFKLGFASEGGWREVLESFPTNAHILKSRAALGWRPQDERLEDYMPELA